MLLLSAGLFSFNSPQTRRLSAMMGRYRLALDGSDEPGPCLTAAVACGPTAVNVDPVRPTLSAAQDTFVAVAVCEVCKFRLRSVD